MQTFALLAPVTFEYVPAKQFVQTVAPDTVEYDPAGQTMQFSPDLYVPTGQGGDTHTLAPAVDVFPAAHAVHAQAPMPEYVLAGH